MDGELDFLTQQKIELLLSMKTKRLQDEVKELREVVLSLRTDLAALHRHVMERPVHVVPEMPRDSPRQDGREQSPTPAQAPKKPQHPRQGNYTSADVSIEKYFNFSNTKR